MDENLTLSRNKIADLLACQRRFQLRHLEQLPWPFAPPEDRSQETRFLGQRFHQIAHRHFLGLSVEEDVAHDPQLRSWWQRFQREGPRLPPGNRLPELSLTIPIGRHLLTGRFDLLILGEGRANIFDWKTEARPRTEVELQDDLQTRLYLALAAEGADALKQSLDPEQISLTYWYVNEPQASVTIDYNQARHVENWGYLREAVDGLDQLLDTAGIWPLTDDLGQCAKCVYQVYCGRISESPNLVDWEYPGPAPSLEPERP